MLPKDIRDHFNRHFKEQVIFLCENDGVKLNRFNPVIDVMVDEAQKFGLKLRFLLPGTRAERVLPKDHPERKQDNRLSVQIIPRAKGHVIGRVFNY